MISFEDNAARLERVLQSMPTPEGKRQLRAFIKRNYDWAYPLSHQNAYMAIRAFRTGWLAANRIGAD